MSLTFKKFTFNPFQENTSLVHNKQEAIIFDPGCSNQSELNEIISYLDQHSLQLKGIYLTHAHIDHVIGCYDLEQKYGLQTQLYKADENTLLAVKDYASLYGFNYVQPNYTTNLEPGKQSFLGEEVEIRFAPGHSAGHIVFIFHEDAMIIGGDVLFQGSIGRTDLPGGDFDTLIKSIKEQLYTLPDHYEVIAGHGPNTSIGHEKKYNPFTSS